MACLAGAELRHVENFDWFAVVAVVQREHGDASFGEAVATFLAVLHFSDEQLALFGESIVVLKLRTLPSVNNALIGNVALPALAFRSIVVALNGTEGGAELAAANPASSSWGAGLREHELRRLVSWEMTPSQ